MFATADNMYILPAHRATVYIIGILLGYALKNFRNISLSQVINLIEFIINYETHYQLFLSQIMMKLGDLRKQKQLRKLATILWVRFNR